MTADDIVKDRGATYTRRQTPLQRYQSNKVISAAQAAAGDELYWAWAIGVQGLNPDPDELPPEVRPPFGPRDPAGYRLDALKRYREAMQALGKPLSWVAVVCCCEITVGSLAKTMRTRRSRLMDDFRAGLDKLAAYWDSTRDSRS